MNDNINLMLRRSGLSPNKPINNKGTSTIGSRIEVRGGSAQQDRMIKDKYRTLLKSLHYSYQGADVTKIDDNQSFRALINPNKLKQDYDDKIISIPYECNYTSGDVFEWNNTNTYWLIYLQDLTELAYFRGDIRRCSYTIEWIDDNGDRKKTYAALRGPVETRIEYIQKQKESIDRPNFSLNFMIPKNDDNLSAFKRYSKFYLQEDKNKTCWRVEGLDIFSTPGIIEVTAVEYYANETEDNREEGLVGTLITKQVDPNLEVASIEGEVFIKPKKWYEYTYTGNDNNTWVVPDDSQVLIQIDENDSKKIKIKWNNVYHGQFDLKYGDCSKTIVVESLF